MTKLPKEIIDLLENMCKYCEKQAIYDKLGNDGDFYYKAKRILTKEKLK